jgi:hypothetical protein
MSTQLLEQFSFQLRRTADDPEPVLLIEGEEVPPGARVEVTARTVAALLYGAVCLGVQGGMEVRRPKIRKTIQRDAQGQIVALVEEPTL